MKQNRRPFIGHTLRKFPVFTATSRFIAHQAFLFYRIFAIKSRTFRYFSGNICRKLYRIFLRFFVYYSQISINFKKTAQFPLKYAIIAWQGNILVGQIADYERIDGMTAIRRQT